MYSNIFKYLSMKDYQNDLAFPYWIYRIEIVVVCGRKFFKIYMYDRTLGKQKLNSVTFAHDGIEATMTSFEVVSEYNDSRIIGCAIETDMEDNNQDITIVKEMIDGLTIYESGKKCKYHIYEFPEGDAYLMEHIPSYKENHEVYPSIYFNYWQCSCGRIHNADDETCVCGQSKEKQSEIIEFNFKKAYTEDYLKTPVAYDTNETFETNINQYKKGFEERYKLKGSILLNHMDIDAEEERYNSLIEERDRSIEKKRHKKKVTIIVIVVIVILLLVGFVAYLFVPPLIGVEVPDVPFVSEYLRGFGLNV